MQQVRAWWYGSSSTKEETTVEEQIALLSAQSEKLEALVLKKENAYHKEMAKAAQLKKEGRLTEARQHLMRAKATQKNMATLTNTAGVLWELACHLQTLGNLNQSYDLMKSTTVMMGTMQSQEGLNPEKVAALQEKIQMSVQMSQEVQEVLSRPTDVAASASGELDFDTLDAELDAINIDEHLNAVRTEPEPSIRHAAAAAAATVSSPSLSSSSSVPQRKPTAAAASAELSGDTRSEREIRAALAKAPPVATGKLRAARLPIRQQKPVERRVLDPAVEQ